MSPGRVRTRVIFPLTSHPALLQKGGNFSTMPPPSLASLDVYDCDSSFPVSFLSLLAADALKPSSPHSVTRAQSCAPAPPQPPASWDPDGVGLLRVTPNTAGGKAGRLLECPPTPRCRDSSRSSVAVTQQQLLLDRQTFLHLRSSAAAAPACMA